MKLLNNFNNKRNHRKEKGMASLMYIFLLTLIAGFLGFGMDAALGNYTANGLKSSMDTATLAAAGQVKYSSKTGTTQYIHMNLAKQTFSKHYTNYRKAYPNVTVKGGYTPKYSWNHSTNPTRMTVSVTEKMNTRFMALIGQKEFVFNLKSSARLGSLYEG